MGGINGRVADKKLPVCDLHPAFKALDASLSGTRLGGCTLSQGRNPGLAVVAPLGLSEEQRTIQQVLSKFCEEDMCETMGMEPRIGRATEGLRRGLSFDLDASSTAPLTCRIRLPTK